ncbi:MAG: ChbG/HpnK family deacetylase [Pseudomonadota bacterium]
MTSKIRLLVRADDAGSSWSSNTGCLRACTDGIARSVEVMMPCAWVPHAAHLFNARPQVDIGVHLTLSSEWDAVKWRPLTHAPSLTDEHGHFLPLVLPRDGDDRPSLAEADWALDEIAREFRAQIALGRAMFHNVSHISSHMLRHFREFDPQVGEVIADLCDEHGLKDDAFGHGLPRFAGYPKVPRETAARIAAFIDELTKLTPGTYIFIDHPAEPSPELDATGHDGYRDVMADRVTCLETLTSDTLMQRIEALGIELIGYNDLSASPATLYLQP